MEGSTYELEPAQEPHKKYTVSVRIRPSLTNMPHVLLAHQGKFVKELRPKSILTYCFDDVYEPQHDNQHIYLHSLATIIKHYLNNRINTTILAYGQTGSGKTHTLFGRANEPGLADHIVSDIIAHATQTSQNVICTFCQIYNEKLTNLLNGTPITLQEDSNNKLIFTNLQSFSLHSKDQLLTLMREAHKNKIFGNSYVHSESSRSHIIFTLELSSTRFNIVDLCGSEVLTYQFDEKQRGETNSINLSLFTLNSVIHDLADGGNKKFIGFRNSLLTRLLKPSLININKSQIYLFCNVSPEREHQEFSSSTLRFGQLAIQIDEKTNIIEDRINLSEQKRQSKTISNIIDIQPPYNTSYPEYYFKWQIKYLIIFGNKVKLYEYIQSDAKCNILVLHAYGGGCSGRDFDLHLTYILKTIPCNIYSVDFPGFAASEGNKFTSRAEKFAEKGQPIDFMLELVKIFEFTKKNKTILLGYDLGGAIALTAGIHPKLAPIVETIIVFHPTWTDSIDKLATIRVPTLLLWFAVETFHLISAGQKMAKTISSATLYRYNIGPYTNEKAGGYYDMYSEALANNIASFISQLNSYAAKPEANHQPNKQRGKIVVEELIENINDALKKQETCQAAVVEYYQLLEKNEHQQVFESLIKGGEDKPKHIRLASELPIIDINVTWDQLLSFEIIPTLPKNIELISQLSSQAFFTPGRQLQIRTTINLNSLSPTYLCYTQHGDTSITHLAKVSPEQTEQQLLETNQLLVDVTTTIDPPTYKQILIDLEETLELNAAPRYQRDTLGSFVFEDSVTCKYSSLLLRLKMIEIWYSIRHIVCNMDCNKVEQYHELQKQCTEHVFRSMDLTHLVHEGIDNTRYTGTAVDRLAYYGQGNCHHLASVLAALLLPFGQLLSFDVLFRAGSFFKTGRELDTNGEPMPGWNGKPRINVEDHTWLEIVYRPTNRVYVFDPSFAICNRPLEEVYSFEGRMHVSGKKLNFVDGYVHPEWLFPNNTDKKC